MSHSSETRIFTAPAASIRSPLASAEDYEALAHGPGAVACARTDKLHHIFGSTRSGYAIYYFGDILANFDFPALTFLTDSGQQYAFEGEYGTTLVEVLDAQKQRAVIEQMNALFAALRADPSIAYDAETFGHLSDGDIENALARDYVSGRPYADTQVYGDEGDTADYLFTYLRSVLKVVENALEEGLLVIYSAEM
ncbi:hypothetical protein HF313_14870 [Massilia atriviolacea]|uniref:DUF1877 family protein n=1 Tax=Massilia atriviolacea TaxID=2495579 RepID=A0A430HR53_9BURK|nr:hypothetical protein [Massilia atriviolacea]RSZ59996.1 hypothetical protein EJB06_07395 [Massilia atriviolacea]